MALALGGREVSLTLPCWFDVRSHWDHCEAQAGAIERAFARLAATDGHCLLSGGNAALLAAHLCVPCQVFENLPLEGLRQLATEI